ncbi:tRNA (adenosine(37)-N6)-threonylcarbamoyltransferase complex dimerization subunit type 1 TsaB [Xylocopilactobacillus apicola]|uniref:tRNA (Adenosine(37)-N6)-threonylcarbamoyltransferase complex dimerization subunit type 1 TsaB n=1 Tax=Xylocopilactobacillus apicola TaxID=2932184 RepID=A0AAU9D5J3_9LACO|nr:tRNA (adenosine(37)-N6)-threonylcarbamoyltransferase complex dimerization subunit type 1 TsaB [Xylocopilactobacillus apicola]BDR58768.1 tRNA (adenosine(37)-N6)-threonylcarbamoyltransferase complex dimerization subunit type 1 TsaB [Xylocopilactobacillus apicola]
MLKLGIDCSEFGVSVALCEDNRLLVENTTGADKRASKFLVPHICDLLSQTNHSLAEVQQISVANGPGSFTGLKIGVTAAKVLAALNHAQLFAVSSLKNLAFNLLHTDQPVLSMISARHGNFYAGIYQNNNGKISTLMNDSYVNFSTLKADLVQFQDLLIVGSGLDEFADELANFGKIESKNLIPKGYSTILLSKDELPQDPDHLVPNYLRDPQAVLVWEKNNPNHENENYVAEIY